MFIETYGCQMNVSDTETVVAIMQREGYVYTDRIGEADVILINTCSIRDNAEQRIWGRLAEMKRYRRERPGLVVGIIGCMAERLREKLVEGPHGVDVVAGPTPTAICRAWSARPRPAARASTCCSRPRRPMPRSLPCVSTATA